jgi:CDP-glucose 4,6-dehydratase
VAAERGALEDLVMFARRFHRKTVWLSGHTGFKGAWLAHWLLQLGARVHGFALAPPTQPALFDQLGLGSRLEHELGDLRDAAAVARSLQAARPDFVFHLAAQSLVRHSYTAPVDTYATNVLGTIHVLEALRALDKPCAAVLVTTDKCYENREWIHGYREVDPLGGYDPYSSSKAAAEIAIASWRRSFFSGHPVRIASARAGNVIGGGDWAPDRILPDCVRALQAKRPIPVRNPRSTRPWQHVLEPLSGYLCLAAALAEPGSPRPELASAFNFGPGHDANRSVGELVKAVLQHWPGRWVSKINPAAVHEASLLQLSIDKANALLGWGPVWPFGDTVEQTVAWYRRVGGAPRQAGPFTTRQIEQYQADAARAGLAWAGK